MPHDHPLCFLSQSPAADELRRNADVILVVGSRVGNLDVPFDKYWGTRRTASSSRSTSSRATSVCRGRWPWASWRMRATRSKASRRSCAAASSRARDALTCNRCVRATGRGWKRCGRQVAGWNGPGIHPAQACAVIGQVFGADPVYVADGGMTSLWAALALPSTRPSSYHSIMEFGMLGTGIPSAIGAKLGAPDREVVCVTGDGAAGFNIMEMQVAARDGVKITTIVMAEGEWTMEIPNEMARYGVTFGTAWARYAGIRRAGLGCHGEYVQSIAELPAALERARAGRPGAGLRSHQVAGEPRRAAGHREPFLRGLLRSLGVRHCAASRCTASAGRGSRRGLFRFQYRRARLRRSSRNRVEAA